MKIDRALVLLVASASAACALMSAYGFDGYSPQDGTDGAAADAAADGGTDATIADAPGGDAPDADTGAIDAPIDCSADLATSPANCGRCGHDCLGGDCEAGTCQPVTLYAQPLPLGIAVNDTTLFWSESASDGGVFRAAKNGADASSMIPPQLAGVLLIGLGPTNLYWNSGTIYRCAIDSACIPETFAAEGVGIPTDIKVGPIVVWSNSDFSGHGSIVGSSEAVPDAAVLADAPNASGVAIDATHIYWTQEGSGPSYTDGLVMSANLDGTNQSVIASDQHRPQRIAVDGAYVYWTNRDTVATSGTVSLCKLGTTCGTVAASIATQQDKPTALALDQTNIYWSNEADGIGGGTIATCAKPTCAGGVRTIARQTYAREIAVDATAVYWANWLNPGGAVRRVAK